MPSDAFSTLSQVSLSSQRFPESLIFEEALVPEFKDKTIYTVRKDADSME